MQYSILHYSVGGYWLDVFGHHPNGWCLRAMKANQNCPREHFAQGIGG